MSESTTNNEQIRSQAAESDLVKELNRLGENLGNLVKATWESDELRSVERELKSGLDQFSKQINKAVDQTRADHGVKKARDTVRGAADTVKGVWETAHGPQVVNEMRMGLVESLRSLNDEIARRAEPKPAQEVHADALPETPFQEVKPE